MEQHLWVTRARFATDSKTGLIGGYANRENRERNISNNAAHSLLISLNICICVLVDVYILGPPIVGLLLFRQQFTA